ncbi:MAG: ABC transporter permease [Leptolyngbya foveolarum]|uniref:ABC transporter permease n=1 Tax=Leptolyngbya foveolarum TaxID=47253 RepID=A0A2W4U9N9_9CYAN|nr:MAG: ABC transporter permease [Leptolyngbya foveolarum]
MVSSIAFWGAIETGLIYGFLSLGVYLSFRVLDFPDLTVDGSFPLGAAVAGTLIVAGVNPFLATGCAIAAGLLAGLCTAFLSVRLGILNLLASILTMTALYSINLRIMGRPNLPLLGQPTVVDPFKDWLSVVPSVIVVPLILLIALVMVKLLLDFFLTSQLGLAMRATGMNPGMAQAQGIRTDRLILLGIAMSNGLAALSGALFAQINGFADVSLGVGTVVIGLATVIVGEALLPSGTVSLATLAVSAGAILYWLASTLALNVGGNFGFEASDLKLVTATIVVIALVLPNVRSLNYLKKRRSL